MLNTCLCVEVMCSMPKGLGWGRQLAQCINQPMQLRLGSELEAIIQMMHTRYTSFGRTRMNEVQLTTHSLEHCWVGGAEQLNLKTPAEVQIMDDLSGELGKSATHWATCDTTGWIFFHQVRQASSLANFARRTHQKNNIDVPCASHTCECKAVLVVNRWIFWCKVCGLNYPCIFIIDYLYVVMNYFEWMNVNRVSHVRCLWIHIQ